jgi:hypothetical protein
VKTGKYRENGLIQTCTVNLTLTRAQTLTPIPTPTPTITLTLTKVKILLSEKSDTLGEKAVEMPSRAGAAPSRNRVEPEKTILAVEPGPGPDRTYGTSDVEYVYHQALGPEVLVIFFGCDVPLVYFRKVHAVSMVIAYAMLFGAGVMFTRRVQDLAECQDIFTYDEAFVVGSVVYEKDGALWLVQPDEL